MKEIYIFQTKFANDMKRNGEQVVIVKDYHNGFIQIKFLSDNKTKKVYDNEIRRA